jgi:hypothetical protein
MADSADTFFGVIVTLAVITAVATGASGGTVPTTNTTGTNPTTTTARVSPASTQSTNIPSGTLFTCGGALTLQVYYSRVNGGRNCAVVSKTGTAVQRPGQLVITLQFHNYDGRKWPRYAIARSIPNATRTGGVYLDNTDNRCVRAWARFLPEKGGRPVTVTSGRVGCR